MMVVCNLRIDFVAGQVPGQLSAVVRMVTPEGQVVASDTAQAVAAGKSLTVGPVQVLTRLRSPCHPFTCSSARSPSWTIFPLPLPTRRPICHRIGGPPRARESRLLGQVYPGPSQDSPGFFRAPEYKRCVCYCYEVPRNR